MLALLIGVDNEPDEHPQTHADGDPDSDPFRHVSGDRTDYSAKLKQKRDGFEMLDGGCQLFTFEHHQKQKAA